MKRLISILLCVAMFVSMAATAVGAAWGDSGVGSAITTADEATYAGNGSAYTFTHASMALIYEHRDLNKSTSTTLVNQVGSLDFTWYNGVYFSSASETDGYYGVGFWMSGNDAAGLTLRYDFARDLFYIQKNSGMGWSSGYDEANIVASCSYDLPTDQWLNLGFHVSNSKAEILLNGEVVVSADVGYTSGSYCYLYCNQVEGYWDNHRFQHVATSYCSSTAHTFLTQYDNVLWDWDTATANSSSPHAHVQYIGSSYTTSAPAGNCGMEWAMDLIGTANNHGTGVSEAQITAANNAWQALSPAQRTQLYTGTYGGYNHLLAQANGYYYITNSTEVANAKRLINAIGAVTYPGSANAINAARAAYDVVAAYQWDVGDNAAYNTWFETSVVEEHMEDFKTKLENAEAQYAKLKEDAESGVVDDVIAKINAIGTVTLNSEAAIKAAENAYAGLTAAQKALVTNYSTLTAARSTYNALVANKNVADAVVAKINAIATPINIGSNTAITEAEDAYAALNATQKALVTNYSTLTNYRTVYGTVSKINAIGEVSYTNLSKNMIDDARNAYNALGSLKSLVGNYATLTAAETRYAELKTAAENQAAADAVIAKINALPAADALTLNDAATVAAARTAYGNLTAAQQKLVSNLATLTAAEARISTLQNAKAQGEAVAAQIAAIGTVTLDSGNVIAAAEAAYAALGAEAKAYVTNYSTLTAARTRYNGLVVTDYISRADAESADATIANEADIRALVAEYDSVKGLATGIQIARLNQALSKLNNALAIIESSKNANVVNKVNATSLVISDSLAINYKINVGSDYEIVRMDFTLADVTTSVTEYTIDASGRLVFRYDNIAPNLMGETIYSVIVVKDVSGKEIKCDAAEYSIAAYANKKMATEGLTVLLASLVNYGDAATAYAGNYTAPSTLITDWDSYVYSVADVRDYVSDEKIGTEIANPEVTWGSANLILSDSIDIRVKIDGTTDDGCVVKTVYNDNEYTFDITSDSGISYFIWDIYNAAQMSSKVTFTVCDADGKAVSNSLTYSVESYVAGMLRLSGDANLKNLLTAMMQYGDAALDYKIAADKIG